MNFFMEIIREYPAMNGPFAPSDEEMEKIEDNPELESRLTEYNIDDDLIYMVMWCQAPSTKRHGQI